MPLPQMKPATLDRIEQVLIAVLWAWLAYRVFSSHNPIAPLILISEFTVLVFVLLRRSTSSISMDPRDWLLAIVPTLLPFMINPAPVGPYVALGIALLVVGNVWQIGAKLFLRRSFGVAPANRGIKMDGPYRLMRHPMYAGYMITHIGVMFAMPSWWNFGIYAACWVLQIKRLLAEEKWLSADQAYQAYMAKVRYRLLPGVF